MRNSRSRWTTALMLALAAHVAMVGVLLWREPPPGALAEGFAGMEVLLGQSGGLAGTVEPLRAVAAAEPMLPQQLQAVAPVDNKRAIERLPATISRPDPVVRPRAPVVHTPEPDAMKPDPARERIEPVKPAPVAAARVEKTPEVVATRVVRSPPERNEKKQPIPEGAKHAPPAPRSEADSTRESTTAMQTPIEEPDAGRARAKAPVPARTGDGADTTSGGRPGVRADYFSALRAWLEKHKQYPRRARRHRQEGTALLYFTLNRDGKVLEYRLQETSGHPLLDREVLAMIERAQPLPQMPDDMNEPRLELVLPVQFQLR